uniref:Uncharacterized protein n=1 Tax=Arundo donax TaxID=35708 RepID=A0A0A9A914_ARUDO
MNFAPDNRVTTSSLH